MIDRDFIFWFAEELRLVFKPIETALRSPTDFNSFLRRYGWSPPIGSFQLADVRAAFDLTADISTGTALIGEMLSPGSVDPPLEKYIALGETFDRIAGKVRALSQTPPPTGLSPQLWTTFGVDLLHGLVADYIEFYQPVLCALLIGVGVVEETPVAADGSPDRIAFVRRRLRWSRLKQVLTDPSSVMRDVYGWGDPVGSLRFELLISRLQRVLGLIGLPSSLTEPGPSLRDGYFTPTQADLPRVRELRVQLIAGESKEGGVFEYTLSVLPIPPVGSPAEAPHGLVLAPSFVLGTQPTALLWPFSLEFGGVFQNESGVRLELEPGRLAVATGGPSSTTVDASFALVFDSPNTHLLIGSAFSHRLQLHGWRVGVQMAGPIDDPDLSLELTLTGLQLVVVLAEGDSFLRELFGTETKEVSFDAGLIWSSKTGLHFRASGTLELVIPVHLTIGPVEVSHVTLSLTATDEETTLTVGVSGSGKVGPVTVAVANVGIRFALTPVPEGESAGAFGDLDVDFGFKFPDGIGVGIETDVVSGGGFLSYDEERQEYAGSLALDFAGVEVSAIGLITTGLPNIQPGYSFVAVVSSEFSPIQLGLGFTLNGVGGLLGINRSASIEALRGALGGSGLGDIFFPDNPIAYAARLTSDLRAFFPPTPGRHVLGPAAIIGWGTPTLVEAELAVVIELPSPVRAILLGHAHSALPSVAAPLIEMNFDVVGLLDFSGRRLEIDAALRDSHVLGFPITGDAAFRMSWGDRPNFALAIGGFHKDFTPPAGFPSLDRVKIAIGAENPRIDIQGYLALTSNTAQFGALAEFYAEKFGLNVHGWVEFHSLFVFRPFSFVADLSAGVDLRRGSTVIAGVHLGATLTGPRPWRVYGEACLAIWLLPDLCVDFDVEWGPGGAIEPPATEIWPMLEEAVRDVRNWSGSASVDASRVVALAPAPGAVAESLLDPMGSLTLRQTIVPLNRRITKFAEAKPAGLDQFDLTRVVLGSATPSFEVVTDYFARAQFEDLTQDERLAFDSFERMDSGFRVSHAEVRIGGVLGKEIVCEQVVLDSANAGQHSGPFTPLLLSQMAGLELAAAALAPLRTSGPRKYSPRPGVWPQIVLEDEQFIVATVAELDARTDVTSPTRHGDVTHALARHLALNPHDQGRLQIVPLHEVANSP